MPKSRSKKSKVSLDFKKTLKSPALWIWTFVYHFLPLLVTASVPSESLNIAVSTIMPKGGKPISPSFLIPYIQLFIFDLIFVIVFYFFNSSFKKYYNILAIFTAIITTNVVFYMLGNI